MSQGFGNFESALSHGLKGLVKKMEQFGCNIKIKDVRRDGTKEKALIALERMYDVSGSGTKVEEKEEENKSIKTKTHPENDGDKGNKNIVDIGLKEIKQRNGKQEIKAMCDFKHLSIENRDGEFYLVECNSKNKALMLDKEEQDTVFVLELEGAQFGEQLFRGDGEMSISGFLKDYEHHMTIGSVSLDSRKMGLCLRNFLAERARDIYDEIVEKDNYSEVKKILLKKFQTQRMREKAELRLKNIVQEESESVLKFTNRLTKIVRLATEGKSEVEFQDRIKYEFCKRVSPNYSYLVNGHNPDTFEEAFEKAELYEYELAIKEGQIRDTANVVEICEGDSSRRLRKLRKGSSQRYEQKRVCYRCRQPGHQAEACKVNYNIKKSRRRRICYRCRQPGHQVKDCAFIQQPDGIIFGGIQRQTGQGRQLQYRRRLL